MTDPDRTTKPVAVSFAAKSTADLHGSIPTQLEDARALAERDGLEIVAEFQDEAMSAYSGDRGPGLARAIAEAERLAGEHGTCALIVQHSDRLARGDGRKAKHLVEYAVWALKAGVTLRSVQDAEMFSGGDYGLLMSTIGGMRNHQDSARKSASTKDGLRRRKENGKPIGALPFGYMVENEIVGGKAVASRVVDPVAALVVEEVFKRIEAGASFGDTVRALNAAGLRGKTSAPFTRQVVWLIIHNAAYAGQKGYPAIVDPDRWQRIIDGLKRPDPAAVQRRKGGRKANDDAHFLRGFSFCRRCGAALYRQYRATGRVYLCRQRHEKNGLCSAPLIPAELVEGHVLRHLDLFVGDVEQWLAEQVKQVSADQLARAAAVDRERAALEVLDQQRGLHLAEYRKLVTDHSRLAHLALEEVDRIDRQREAQEQTIAQAQSVVSEWEGPPNLDRALDFYTELVELVQGRIQRARGVVELNQALSQVIAGLWVEVDGDRLHAEFQLRLPEEAPKMTNGLAQVLAREGRRVALPSTVYPGNPDETELVEASLRWRAEGRPDPGPSDFFAARSRHVADHGIGDYVRTLRLGPEAEGETVSETLVTQARTLSRLRRHRPTGRRRRPILGDGRSALPRLSSAAGRQGPGGLSGLQNRQGVATRRLEGSIPSPLRAYVDTALSARRATSARTTGATCVPNSSIERSTSAWATAPTLICAMYRWWSKSSCS